MSDIIQLLPDHVANQIAAGEVVQRPSSVVKELMENAIDANASKVELIIREAGKNLVQVVDNGTGMSDADALLAFQRHATSKIKTTEDIFNIGSKGFRGEALASIAAVAQVELKTKQSGATAGTNIYIEGGGLQFQEPTQTHVGASFSVKNLFYNIPARRKFLKNNNVELRHVIDEFQRIALAHNEVEFDFYHNDEPLFRLRKGTALHRIVEIFGRRLQPLLLPISEDLDWIKLSGYIAKPEGSKKTRGEQFFFANKRFFKSPYLNKAVQEAFEGLLQPGYIPSFFLFLEIDPHKIDVNIHPQKTEIKFEDENLIFALIRSTIKKALGIYNVAPSLDFDRDPKMDAFFSSATPSQSSMNSPGRSLTVNRDFNPFKSQDYPQPGQIEANTIFQEPLNSAPSKINLFEEEEFQEDLLRLPNGYWIYNKGAETLILDPGRMHRLLQQNQKAPKPASSVAQSLLFSIEYHMNEIEKVKYKSIKKYLPELGFDMKLAQENVLRIDAVPQGLKESQVNTFMERIFEILEYRSEEDFMSYFSHQWNRLHSKSRFDFIYKHEMEDLIRRYLKIGFPKYDPNGKKCYTELSLEDINTKF